MSTTIVGEKPSTFVFMATMGDRVRAERTAKGWSYQDLAERVSKIAGEKCPRVSIEKIEDRSSTASKWSIHIATALGVDHRWLLTGKGPRTAPAAPLYGLDRLVAEFQEAYGEEADILREDLERAIDERKKLIERSRQTH
jgi:transcriptional regulator with XRE-family HTH domain